MQTAIIDRDRIRQSLEDAFNEVLETMFFELPVDSPAGAAPVPGARGAEAAFTGETEGRRIQGRYQIAVEPPMLSRLAQDFLGLDELEPPGETQTTSVLSELANMLCGSTLSRLVPEARLRIAPPQPAGLDALVAACAEPWIETPLECGRMWVRVEVREDA